MSAELQTTFFDVETVTRNADPEFSVQQLEAASMLQDAFTKELTSSQKAFVATFLDRSLGGQDIRATKAAYAGGYVEHDCPTIEAKRVGNQVARKSKPIRRFLEMTEAYTALRAQVGLPLIKLEFKAIAFANMGDFINSEGDIELPDESDPLYRSKMAAVKKYSVNETFDKETGELVSRRTTFELYDKIKALETLCKLQLALDADDEFGTVSITSIHITSAPSGQFLPPPDPAENAVTIDHMPNTAT